jgi:serine/threonine protein phosphatase PrpC
MIANVGDCGIMVIRDSQPIFRSEEQQHSFNFPFQLGTQSTDFPRDADTFSVKVEEGDIVLVGTDGVFDNVTDEEILAIVQQETSKSPLQPKPISDAILKKAREVAEDPRIMGSPFQTRASQQGFYYQGGKMDDITILTGIVRYPKWYDLPID